MNYYWSYSFSLLTLSPLVILSRLKDLNTTIIHNSSYLFYNLLIPLTGYLTRILIGISNTGYAKMNSSSVPLFLQTYTTQSSPFKLMTTLLSKTFKVINSSLALISHHLKMKSYCFNLPNISRN